MDDETVKAIIGQWMPFTWKRAWQRTHLTELFKSDDDYEEGVVPFDSFILRISVPRPFAALVTPITTLRQLCPWTTCLELEDYWFRNVLGKGGA